MLQEEIDAVKMSTQTDVVLVRKCDSYDREAIESIVVDGMAQLGFSPKGKVFVKPNVVFANKPEIYGTHAYTAAAFVGASLKALADADDVERVDLGENSAVGFPARVNYKYAGYYKEVRRVRKQVSCPVGIFCMDEERRDPLFVGGRVHDTLRVSRKMARADTKVYLPKLKCHCVSNMTGAVKLNVGICCDDERSIRHDFLLHEKIVDLLDVGVPDFIVMDAIEVGVGNEAFPSPRKLGLILMGTNPVAVDLIGARLLGFSLDDVPYLRAAVDRGYTPSDIGQIRLTGDVQSLDDIDAQARKLLPYDDEFNRWNDVHRELARLESPIRFVWGPHAEKQGVKCGTGCVMGLKMFLGAMERFAGAEAFKQARPVVFVIGRCDETIDASGSEVFLLGYCAAAEIKNAKKVIHIKKCFTTASDMNLKLANRLGMRSPMRDIRGLAPLFWNILVAGVRKIFTLRYFQDMHHFFSKSLIRRV
jgi:uncharacterized protein (DUF362 family)